MYSVLSRSNQLYCQMRKPSCSDNNRYLRIQCLYQLLLASYTVKMIWTQTHNKFLNNLQPNFQQKRLKFSVTISEQRLVHSTKSRIMIAPVLQLQPQRKTETSPSIFGPILLYQQMLKQMFFLNLLHTSFFHLN